MTLRTLIDRIAGHDGLNFALTNRIPRRAATRLAGWIARMEWSPAREISLWLFRLFCSPDLSEARKARFDSLRDCFIRELKDGARPLDRRPGILTSPCDANVVACGAIESGTLVQVKGSTYDVAELVRDPDLAGRFANGCFVSLRLTAGMYHRFHAPYDGTVTSVRHIAGDVWNVNPPALRRVPRLYCRNERAVVTLELAASGHTIALVPVAAVLVAGLRLHCAELPADRFHRGPWRTACREAVRKGEEMGWFEHGSTIVVLAPAGFEVCHGIDVDTAIRTGEPLLRLPQPPAQPS